MRDVSQWPCHPDRKDADLVRYDGQLLDSRELSIERLAADAHHARGQLHPRQRRLAELAITDERLRRLIGRDRDEAEVLRERSPRKKETPDDHESSAHIFHSLKPQLFAANVFATDFLSASLQPFIIGVP